MLKEEQTGNKERFEKTNKLHVLDETERLKEVVLWGEPGVEAILGQQLNIETSLFFRSYDVEEARIEFKNLRTIYERHGVKIVLMKDIIANMFKEKDIPKHLPRNLARLKKELIDKGHIYSRYYEMGNSGMLDLVDRVVECDAEQYGENGAIWLNYILSLRNDMENQLPLANIVFARDQSDVVGDIILLSKMRWPIRQPEVDLYKLAYESLGYTNFHNVTTGTFEGGDGIMFKNTFYVGVGVRTSESSVLEFFNNNYYSLRKKGIKVAMVVNPRQIVAESDVPGNEQINMHLDTVWQPLDQNNCIGWMEDIATRDVYFLEHNKDSISKKYVGKFHNHLESLGVGILEITAEEQENFAPNFVNIDSNTTIVSLSSNQRVANEMQKRGQLIESAELNNLTGAGGGGHCAEAALVRHNI